MNCTDTGNRPPQNNSYSSSSSSERIITHQKMPKYTPSLNCTERTERLRSNLGNARPPVPRRETPSTVYAYVKSAVRWLPCRLCWSTALTRDPARPRASRSSACLPSRLAHVPANAVAAPPPPRSRPPTLCLLQCQPRSNTTLFLRKASRARLLPMACRPPSRSRPRTLRTLHTLHTRRLRPCILDTRRFST